MLALKLVVKCWWYWLKEVKLKRDFVEVLCSLATFDNLLLISTFFLFSLPTLSANYETNVFPYTVPYLYPTCNTFMTCSIYMTVGVAVNRYLDISDSCRQVRRIKSGYLQVSISPTLYEQLFLFKSVFMSLQIGFVNFCRKVIVAKVAHKMLVKLATGCHHPCHVCHCQHSAMVWIRLRNDSWSVQHHRNVARHRRRSYRRSQSKSTDCDANTT